MYLKDTGDFDDRKKVSSNFGDDKKVEATVRWVEKRNKLSFSSSRASRKASVWSFSTYREK